MKIAGKVNTIAPGLMEAPLLGSLPADVLDSLAKSVLYPKRLGKPAEIGFSESQIQSLYECGALT
jgi:hypothetical protein